MKNYLSFILFVSLSSFITAQSTLYQTYGYPTGFLTGYERVYPVVYGNSLFFGYTDYSISPDMAPCVQKNNLDGIPLWKKAYKGLGEAHRIVAHNGKIILCGQTTIGTGTNSIAHVFIAAIDTSSGNMNYLSEHEVPGYFSVSINCAKVLSNGDIILGGSAFMQSVSCCRGYLARFNASNGSLVYQRLITIDSQLESPIKSVEEINNASLLISGSHGLSNYFVAKISNNANPVIANAKSYNYPPDNISKLAPNRFLIHTGAAFLKIDSTLNPVSIMPNWSTTSFGIASAYHNGKIYVSDNTKKMAVLDTAGAVLSALASHSYNVSGNTAYTYGYFAFNNSSAFLTYDFGSTGGPFSLIKTDLDGNLGACSLTQTVSVSSFANSSGTVSYSVSTLTGTLGATTPTMVNGTVSQTLSCLTNVGLIKRTGFYNTYLYYLNEGVKVICETDISAIELYDSSGKLIKSEEVNQNEYVMPFTIVQQGLYLLHVKFANGGRIPLKVIMR